MCQCPVECLLQDFHILVLLSQLRLGRERFTALLDCLGGEETEVSGVWRILDLMIFFDAIVTGDKTRPPLCSLKSNSKVSQERRRKLNK